MPMIPPTSPAGDFEFKKVPQGQHPAILYGIVDAGTHDEAYLGAIKKKRKVFLYFEFPTCIEELTPGKEEPLMMVVSHTYSLSSQAKLRSFVQSIIGNPISDSEAEVFDMETLMGKKILANVAHITNKKGETRAEIISCMPLPEIVPCPTLTRENILYTVENHNESMFNKLSKKMKERVMSADEMQIGTGAPSIHSIGQPKVKIEDVPF